jgi:hypothetical protein
MTTSQDPEEPRRDGSGDESGNFDEDFLDADSAARKRLDTPALLLIIATSITIIPCFLVFALALLWSILGMFLSEFCQDIDLAALWTLLGLLAVLYLLVILRGAIRMRQFQNYGQVRAAVLLGMFSITFLNVASVFVLPCAIWAWVVLKDPLVKKQFRSL